MVGWLVGTDWEGVRWREGVGDFIRPFSISFSPKVASIIGPQSAKLIKCLCQQEHGGKKTTHRTN